jgi:HK97 family phage portal protein
MWLQKKLTKYIEHIMRQKASLLETTFRQYQGANYVDYLKGYIENELVYACVNLISDIIANYEVNLVKGEQNKEFSHPAGDAIKGRVNQLQSGRAFTKHMVSELLQWGNGAAFKIPMSMEYQLVPLYWNDVTVMDGKTTEELIKSYKYKEETYPPEEIFHIRLYNPESITTGAPPLKTGKLSIETNYYLDQQNSQVIKNGSVMEGIFTQKDVPQDQLTKLSEELRKLREIKGARPLLPEGITYQQLANTPRDLQYAELYMKILRRIAAIYRVPAEIIGDSVNKTYSNIQEAWISLHLNTCIPLAETYYQELSYSVFQTEKDTEKPRFMINYEKIPAIVKSRISLIESLERAHMLTINEKREILEKEPVKNGDEILLPLNLQTIDEMGGEENPQEGQDEEKEDNEYDSAD